MGISPVQSGNGCWSDQHPDIPEPQLRDTGINVVVEITVNGAIIEMHFDTKEDAYNFCTAYGKATYAQGSFICLK